MEPLMLKNAVRTAIVLLAFGAAAWGQTPVGPNVQVNTYTTGTQLTPSVGVEPDGDFVIVWWSHLQGPVVRGVFGQRFDASGMARGGEFQINSNTADAFPFPEVAVGSAGDFIVVWDTATTIHGRRYDAAGTPVGGEFEVNSSASGTHPQVALAADGRFVVTWSGFFDVFARRFDPSGNPIGDEFIVNSLPQNLDPGSDVAVDANGNFVVVWSSYCMYGCFDAVLGQRFDAAGNRVGDEFEIDSGSTDYRPSASMAPSGDFVVAWTGGYDGDVLATAVTGTVNTYTPGLQINEIGAIAHDGGGNFIITWTSMWQDGDGAGVFGQRFDGFGNRIGAEFQVNTYTSGGQEWPVVGADAAGNFVVAWRGANPQQGGGIFAQRFSPQIPTSDVRHLDHR